MWAGHDTWRTVDDLTFGEVFSFTKNEVIDNSKDRRYETRKQLSVTNV